MGNFGSFIQIIIFVVVILGPTIGAISRKVKVHAEEKRIEAERQKRRIESIRTGRTIETASGVAVSAQPGVSAEQTRSEAAEAIRRQRQQQIAELRRRYQAQQQAQQRARQGSPQQPQGTPRRSAAPQVSTAQGRTASSSTAKSQPKRVDIATQRQAEIERRRAEASRREAQGQAKKRPARKPSPQQPPAVETHSHPTASSHHVSRPEKRPANRTKSIASHPLAAALSSTDDLRRAIILSEVLAPPVALRRQEENA